mmetsp:Transcript_490/g.1241  ORF Transcript_490/g.1241 Transcript_490/m.1241 type:complete len:232 (-) Transcript_490:70-765(-)
MDDHGKVIRDAVLLRVHGHVENMRGLLRVLDRFEELSHDAICELRDDLHVIIPTQSGSWRRGSGLRRRRWLRWRFGELGLQRLLLLEEHVVPGFVECHLHFLCHLVDICLRPVVRLGIVEGEPHVAHKLVHARVGPRIHARPHSPQVHGAFDTVKVVGDAELHRIYGVVEGPCMRVVHGLLEHLLALAVGHLIRHGPSSRTHTWGRRGVPSAKAVSERDAFPRGQRRLWRG